MWAPPPKFGPALHMARILRGFSRSYVARESRVPVSRLKYIEEGRDEPDAYEWTRIWSVLSAETPDPADAAASPPKLGSKPTVEAPDERPQRPALRR